MGFVIDVVDVQDAVAAGDDDHRVPRGDHRGAVGDDDAALVDQHGDQDALLQGQVLQGHPLVAGGVVGHELHGLGMAVGDLVQGVHHAALGVLHTPHHLEDLGGGEDLGGDDAVQAGGVGDARVVLPVGLGHHLGNALLHGEQGDDQVVLIPVGEGHKGVGRRHVLLLQQALVGAVAAEDGGVGEQLAEQAAAGLVPLHDLHLHALPLQDGGQVVGDAPAPHQEHVAALGGVAAQQAEEGGQAAGLADHIEPVPRLGHEGAVGDHHVPPLPLRRAEEHGQGLELVALGGQGMAGHEVPLPHPEADELHPAPAEGLQIGRRREAEQPGDLHRRGVLRIDHHVDAQGILQKGQLLGVLHVAHPGDGVPGAQSLGRQAADHVDLIHAGRGDHHVCAPRLRLPQGGQRRAIALDAQDVQGLRGPAEGIVIGVNDRDVVLLLGEVFRQGKADLAISHDDDFQTCFIPFKQSQFNPAHTL